MTPGLSVVEWKPKADSGGVSAGCSARSPQDLASRLPTSYPCSVQVSEGRLDGLVSLWHPASSSRGLAVIRRLGRL